MPKRVIDGEGLWRSDKLARVEPAIRRAEYANLVPLALANGVFEANPRRIWAAVYAYNRPDVTESEVAALLEEFERAKLLFRWTESDGKVWGYWTGIEKPGRLPGESRRGKNEAVGPTPPMDSMRKFVESNGIHTETIEQPNGTDLRLGFGFCLGLGSGIGVDSNGIHEEQETATSTEKIEGFNSTEVARALCSENGWSGEKILWALKDAIEFQSKQVPEASLEQVGEWLVRAYADYRAEKGNSALLPQIYFSQALYRPPSNSGRSKTNVLIDNPATRAQAQMEAD
jgi:hypothetical protein